MELIIFILILGFSLVVSGIKIINQYERGVVLTLGRYTGMRNPGLRVVIPVFQKLYRVDQRTNTIDIPKQEVITKDNVTVNVDAVVYFRVKSAEKAVLEVANYVYASSQFAQAALRDVTGNIDLDDLLSERESVSQQIEEIVDAETEKWGIDIENVKIQNIELPQDMKRAMARQAEAERDRRAVVIDAEGERQAAKGIADAAGILANAKSGMNIRTLQTLERISGSSSQKTLVILPSEMTGTTIAEAITMSEASK